MGRRKRRQKAQRRSKLSADRRHHLRTSRTGEPRDEPHEVERRVLSPGELSDIRMGFHLHAIIDEGHGYRVEYTFNPYRE